MFSKHIAIQITFILLVSLLPFAYGEKLTRVIIYNEVTTANTWPDGYYFLYGFCVAAIVLFVMAVMKKHDEMT